LSSSLNDTPRPLIVWATTASGLPEVVGSNNLGAEVLRKRRPAAAFVDEAVRSERHDQEIAQPFGLIEMADVAHMQQIKNAMALHDASVIFAQRLEVLRQVIQLEHFYFFGHASVRSRLTTLRRIALRKTS
jgi:hypothetical protein